MHICALTVTCTVHLIGMGCYTLDLMKLPKVPGLSVETGDLGKHIQQVQADVKNKLKKANAKYKMEADKHRRFKSFDVGDRVMVFISKARMQGGHSKLQKRKYGSYQLLIRSTTMLMWLTCSVG